MPISIKHPRLINKNGQHTLEYIILFAIIAGLTFVTLTSWDDNIKTALQNLFSAAADQLTQ